MRRNAAGHLAALVTILIWGTTFISTKVLLRAFTPIEILFLRFAIGYLALWCVCPRRLAVEEKKREACFAAAGLCGVALYYLCENVALTYTLASHVGVIISIAPFFTALFACVFLRERRPGARFFLGFALAMAGIALLSFQDAAQLRLDPVGDLLAVAAAVLWAAYATLTKVIAGFGYGILQTTRRTFFYGLVFMAPSLLLWGFQVRPAQFGDPAVLFNLLFLGLGASALCFVTWNTAVKALGAVKTSVYIYLVPVITAVTSALVLGERVTPAAGCGIGLTLAGLLLSQQKSKETERENHGAAI